MPNSRSNPFPSLILVPILHPPSNHQYMHSQLQIQPFPVSFIKLTPTPSSTPELFPIPTPFSSPPYPIPNSKATLNLISIPNQPLNICTPHPQIHRISNSHPYHNPLPSLIPFATPTPSLIPSQLYPFLTRVRHSHPWPSPCPCPVQPCSWSPTHGFRQWAAVSSHCGFTSTAPQ